MLIRLLSLCFLVLLLLPVSASAQVIFFPLGDLEGEEFRSGATQIARDASVVVGVGTSTASGANGREAFKWDTETGSVPLGFLPGGAAFSIARAASDDAAYIVGESSSALSGSNSAEAFRWDAVSGMLEALGELPGGSVQSVANAVSSDGSIVVGSSSSAMSGSPRGEAFLWTAAEGQDPAILTGLGFLPFGGNSAAFGVSGDGTVLAGASSSSNTGSNGLEAFVWTAEGGMESIGDLPGGLYFSYATAISTNASTIVGASSSSASGSGLVEAFRWTEAGGMEGLGDLAGGLFDSEAFAVSDDGSLIGGRASSAATPSDTAFIWDESEGMRSVKDVVENAGIDLGTWRLEAVTGISGDGRFLVGTATNPSGFEEGWAVDLPEPGSALLQWAAIAGVALLTRRWPNRP